jgi:hypothetical protein
MILALRAFGSAIRQVFRHFGSLLLANLLATALSLPVVALVGAASYLSRSYGLMPLGIALLVGVLPNPGSAGLQFMARELARGEILAQGDQWVGLRQLWSLALKIWLLAVPVTVLLIVNVVFYMNVQTPVSGLLFVLWLLTLLAWLAVHVYVYPLIAAHAVRRVVLIYRNAVIMALSRPIFTLSILAVWLAVLLAGAATGVSMVLGLALAAAIQQCAFARILPSFRTATVS